jgi:seryl-tRNA synthetase
MNDIKRIITEPDKFRTCMKNRNQDPSKIDELLKLDTVRRSKINEVEAMRSEKNKSSQDIAKVKKEGGDISAVSEKMKVVSGRIKELETELENIEVSFNNILYTVPNLCLDDVPVGKDSADNKVVRTWGEKPVMHFKPKDHVDIGEKLDIIDLQRAGKVTGARFVFMKGMGAKLERALINYMLDLHTTKHGYTELFPPFMVNDTSLFGTGQLPKFKEDLFKIENYPFYLIPTAEVPVTNYYADEILEPEKLPVKFAAYSACFRSEAGSYGKDTRGTLRQHEFNKVELVKFTHPDKSIEEHEALTRDAEKVLQTLGLHYRTVALSTGDIGFGAAKCYDLEVWLPSIETYKEISSCSNFWDFQARRAKIRFRDPVTGKPALCHTINGSGLAIGRTVIAILDQYQQEDGTVVIPEALRGYMGGASKIG